MTVVTAHVSSPKPGEYKNGDAAFVRKQATRAMLAVVDGLGHGANAAAASEAALARLATVELEAPLGDIMRAVHADLKGTRGAAATVCLLHGRTLDVCAVGNVQLSAWGASLPLVLSAGVLGHQVAKFRVCRGQLGERVRLALYSDGISTRVRWPELEGVAPQAACETILALYRRREDDATILIADVEV